LRWSAVSTNAPSDAPFTLVDPAPGSAPYRFYRVITP
jgi:hypothetical protein